MLIVIWMSDAPWIRCQLCVNVVYRGLGEICPGLGKLVMGQNKAVCESWGWMAPICHASYYLLPLPPFLLLLLLGCYVSCGFFPRGCCSNLAGGTSFLPDTADRDVAEWCSFGVLSQMSCFEVWNVERLFRSELPVHLRACSRQVFFFSLKSCC